MALVKSIRKFSYGQRTSQLDQLVLLVCCILQRKQPADTTFRDIKTDVTVLNNTIKFEIVAEMTHKSLAIHGCSSMVRDGTRYKLSM